MKDLIVFAAVRKAMYEDEFIDISSITEALRLTQNEISKETEENPHWHKANPVQRICQFVINEIQ